MLDLPKEFSLSGFLEETEEDGTVLYVMDFPDDVYITVTDDNGRTPVRAKQNLVLACYDGQDLHGTAKALPGQSCRLSGAAAGVKGRFQNTEGDGIMRSVSSQFFTTES